MMKNINEYLQETYNQFMANYCIVNGTIMKLDDIKQMGYDDFSLMIKKRMPLKIYKYFPNVIKDGHNYSMEALENNTVYMQSPMNFDDPYDSNINIDFNNFKKIRLIEYCRRCEMDVSKNDSISKMENTLAQAILQSHKRYGNFDYVFTLLPNTETESLRNKLFIKKIAINVSMPTNLEYVACVVNAVLNEEYKKLNDELKNTFSTSCFTTSPFSQLMWGGTYGNCHKGFCAEYTIEANLDEYKDIYLNLFPMIYCKTRPDMSELLIKYMDNDLDNNYLWDIYSNGVLRKSIDWAYQNEWRLLKLSSRYGGSNIKFYPITGVYLGNRMNYEDRKKIIEHCNAKGIPYYGVIQSPNLFEMKACSCDCAICSLVESNIK